MAIVCDGDVESAIDTYTHVRQGSEVTRVRRIVCATPTNHCNNFVPAGGIQFLFNGENKLPSWDA